MRDTMETQARTRRKPLRVELDTARGLESYYARATPLEAAAVSRVVGWLTGTALFVDSESNEQGCVWENEGRRRYVRLPVRFHAWHDTLHPDAVFHELAHFLEVVPDARRVRAFRWGIKVPQQRFVIAGREYSDPNFTAPYATRREIRTFALEARLAQAAGLEPKPPEDVVRVLHHLPDWIVVPGKSQSDQDAWRAEQYRAAVDKVSDEDVLARLNAVRRLWWMRSPTTFHTLTSL